LSGEQRRLPLRRIIFSAFTLPWEHRNEAFRAIAMPLLAVIACTLAWQVVEVSESLAGRVAQNLIYSIVYAIATSWLAIEIHRLVLLDAAARGRLDIRTLRRLVLFCGVLLGLGLLHAAVTMLISNGILGIFIPPRYVPAGTGSQQVQQAFKLPFPPQWIINAAAIASYWFVGRLSLMLPAIAIDQKADLVAAWRASQRNGWRLAVIVGALPWCLGRLIDFMYRGGATSMEIGILVVLGALFIVVEVVALSLSYWELTSPPDA
jgi:hypothetical protein